jgi:hypothetical protein
MLQKLDYASLLNLRSESDMDHCMVEEDAHRMEGKVGRGQTDGYLTKHQEVPSLD